MQKLKLWQIPFSQRQQRHAGQTIDITWFHPFLYFLLIDQGFFSALAAHYWQVPSTLWASASSLARINPLTSQGSCLTWLDLASGWGLSSAVSSTPQACCNNNSSQNEKSVGPNSCFDMFFSFTIYGFSFQVRHNPLLHRRGHCCTPVEGRLQQFSSALAVALYSACALFLPQCLSSCPDRFFGGTSPRWSFRCLQLMTGSQSPCSLAKAKLCAPREQVCSL